MNETATLISAPSLQISRTSLVIAGLSTIIEWYDFTLYLYLVTVLSRVFFGDGAASVATTLAGFALAYLMRPFGAIAFGHFGDRYGRRQTMLASMSLMTVAMLATALLPTQQQIGPSAGLLLIGLRCLMAFAVGGEYTGVIAYLIEGAPLHRRGLVTSLASAAAELGGLLAAAAGAVTAALVDAAALSAWAWRIPFLFGATLAALVLIARASLDESPEFMRQQSAGSIPALPAVDALQKNGRAIARGFAISALGSISYYVGVTYVPAFLTATGAMTEATALSLATIAAVVVIVVTPIVGSLSDLLGRRPVLLVVTALCAILPISLFGMMTDASLPSAVLGAVVLAALGGAFSAVGAVATAELLPGEGRLSGLAFGASGATAIFGGLTPWLAQSWILETGSAAIPGIMIALVAMAVAPILWLMPETRPAP